MVVSSPIIRTVTSTTNFNFKLMSINDSLGSSDTSTVGASHKFPPIGPHSNHVKLGIVGMPNAGKSKLFNAFIRNPDKFSPSDSYLFCTIDPYVESFLPEDHKFEFLTKIFRPEATSPARITIIDTAGLVEGSFHDVKLKLSS